MQGGAGKEARKIALDRTSRARTGPRMHQIDGQVRFPARDSRLSAIKRIEGDRPLLSKSNLARPAGYTTEDLLQTSAAAASYLRSYAKSSAASAATQAFPQVAIGAISIDGYTTEDSLQTSAPNCSEFAVVYQSPPATPGVGEGMRVEGKPPPRFPPAEGRSPRGAPGTSPARPSERRLPTAPPKKSAKSSKRRTAPIRGEPLPRSSADFNSAVGRRGKAKRGARGRSPAPREGGQRARRASLLPHPKTGSACA